MSLTAIDLFAGAGGFTEGATAAGIDVLWAANHWPEAVQVHANNHPETAHICQDLHQADWTVVPSHDVLLASPCCQGHSKSRGKERSHHDASRSTAWAVISCAEYHRPEVVLVENVPEFREWVLYPAWLMALRALGYTMMPHLIDAADCGVPQNRERLFLVGTQSRSGLDLGRPQEAHTPISAILDWEAGRWSQIERKGRSEATLARVANGRSTFGDRFVMPYYGRGSGLTGRCLTRPVGTLTTRARWALVDGDRMRMMSVDECKQAMGFPSEYMLPKSPIKLGHHLLGNAVCPPVATWLLDRVQAVA